MKLIKFISIAAKYFVLILAAGYLGTSLYSLVAYALPDVFASITETQFAIYYPFTKSHFLLLENNSGYKFFFSLLMAAYGTFFYLLYRIFRIFGKEPLFTEEGVRALGIFASGNLALPLVLFILYSVFVAAIDTEFILVVVHAVLGVFTIFLRVIFKEGVKLQVDKDLTI